MESCKFDETLDIAINLDDPKQSDQIVRVCKLTSWNRKKLKVAVLQKTKVKEATDAGADYSGQEDLAEKIKKQSES